jgi:hypothetical protein
MVCSQEQCTVQHGVLSLKCVGSCHHPPPLPGSCSQPRVTTVPQSHTLRVTRLLTYTPVPSAPSHPPSHPAPTHVQVKGVSFFGEDDEYVCSGSDCGHVFLWDKAHGTVVLWEEADAEVVNCLEPHPRLPLVLATSGGLSCIAGGGRTGREAGKYAEGTLQWCGGKHVQIQKKDVTKGHASNYVATDPSHGGTQPARKGADRTNSILRKARHAHSVCLQIAKGRLWQIQ